LKQFSAGLSVIQLENFRSHHVIATVLMENAPQVVLQYVCLFELNLSGAIVIVSFMSSVFNILMAIVSTIVFHILHRKHMDIPFTINILWRRKLAQGGLSPLSLSHTLSLESPSVGTDALDPYYECGRRSKLAELLGQMNLGGGKPMKFEILSSKQQQSGAILFGVFVAEQSTAANEGDLFADLVDPENEREIKKAVIKALELGSMYGAKFVFKICISRTIHISVRERAKLILNGLRDFKAPPDLMSAVQQLTNQAIHRSEPLDGIEHDERVALLRENAKDQANLELSESRK